MLGFQKTDRNNYSITHSSTFQDALNKLKEKKFGAILLDLNLPDGQGLDAIDVIHQINPDLPIVIVTGLDDENTASQALEKGAQEYIVKTHINKNIVRRIVKSSILRKKVERALTEKAYTDPLTGLPNRSAFEQSARNLLAKAKRWKTKDALFFIDLNKFKTINDTYGHEAGNVVLNETAKRLQATLRESDLIARYAGDEFICYLDSNGSLPVTRQLCEIIAKKITKAIEEPINIGTCSIEITLSIGIAIYPDAGETFDLLLNNADSAMYTAKQNPTDKYCFVENNTNSAVLSQETNTSDFLDLIRSSTLKDSVKTINTQHNQESFYADFATTLAHDLKSPVRKIITFSDLLLSSHLELKEADKAYFLKRVSISAVRLNKLLESLLDFGQSIQRPLQKNKISMSNTVKDLIEDMEEILQSSHTTIQTAPLSPVI